MAEDSKPANTSQDPFYIPEYDDNELDAVSRQYAATKPDTPRRIHMIGIGSIGKFVAHSLLGSADPPPITLILHRQRLVDKWKQGFKEIVLRTGEHDVARGGFDVEFQPPVRLEHGVELRDGQPSTYDFGQRVRPHEAAELLREQNQQDYAFNVYSAQHEEPPFRSKEFIRQQAGEDDFESDEPIHNLIISTKTTLTISALSSIRHRLSRDSTIVFLQNGMGTIDEVNDKIFPDPATRPSYVQGVISHGVNDPRDVTEYGPFFAVHAGQGTIALSIIPRSKDELHASSDPSAPKTKDDLWPLSARYMVRTLTRVPVLCAVGFTPIDLLQHQLEKLAVNSVLNPLTSLIDAPNGSLLYNFALTRTIRLMLAETSLVIRSLPELQGVPNVATRFSPSRLETTVFSIAHNTKDNISSMLSDVRRGLRPEVDYINGYIVRRGEELGIKCVVNYAMMQAVLGKTMVVRRESHDDVPLEKEEALYDKGSVLASMRS